MTKKRILWPYSIAAIAVIVVIGGIWLCWANSPTRLILVRHAEKQSTQNPLLTDDGSTRAQRLVQVVDDALIGAVYATEWCRTALTAEPSAVMLGFDIRIQDNGVSGDQLVDCGLTQPTILLDPSIATAADLVAHVLSTHRGEAVLIVGHSNTVPQMVEALGIESLCPRYFPQENGQCHIPDEAPNDEYHHLFVLEVPRWFGVTRLVKAEYGD